MIERRQKGMPLREASPKETVVVVGDLRQCGRAETRAGMLLGARFPTVLCLGLLST